MEYMILFGFVRGRRGDVIELDDETAEKLLDGGLIEGLDEGTAEINGLYRDKVQSLYTALFNETKPDETPTAEVPAETPKPAEPQPEEADPQPEEADPQPEAALSPVDTDPVSDVNDAVSTGEEAPRIIGEDPVAQYATGGNWYVFPVEGGESVRVRGRNAALAELSKRG